MSKLAKFGVIVGVNAAAGGLSSGVTAILANVTDHNPWYQGVLESMGIGLGEGAVLAGLGEGLSKASKLTVQDLNSGIDTMVDRAVAAARTQEGTAVLMVGAFASVSGILVGGVLGVVKSQKS